MRFRPAWEIERAQIKWLLFAVALIASAFILVQLSVTGAGLLQNLFALGIPLAIRQSILRYRLFDLDVIDRRFNRSHYDAEKMIEAFAATVRNETDLDALTAEILRVIQQTMEPESVSIMLFNPSAVKRRSKVTAEQNSVC